MSSIRLYLLQRISAVVMAPLVLVHLGVMIYAIQGGLTADEILGRTQGSLLWALVYGAFVVAVAVHGAIGLRAIAYEWGKISDLALDILMWIFGCSILLLGGRAVYAVTAL